nr:MAG TPA: hypothetical protein [Caudoviricetes sp.]
MAVHPNLFFACGLAILSPNFLPTRILFRLILVSFVTIPTLPPY